MPYGTTRTRFRTIKNNDDNEHAVRIHDPNKYDSFRRENDKFGSGIHVIWGLIDGTTEVQAVRFDKSKFTPEEAKSWLKDHDYKYIEFEPASGSRSVERRDYINPPEIDTQQNIVGKGILYYDGTPKSEYSWNINHLDGEISFVERIMPGALKDVDLSDVVGLFNHDTNMILGRVSAGSMKIDHQADHVRYTISPGNTTIAKDVSEWIKRKEVKGSSFSFIPGDQRIIEEKDKYIREILSIWNVYDIGPVTFPAYQNTTAEISRMLIQDKTHLLRRAKLRLTLAQMYH